MRVERSITGSDRQCRLVRVVNVSWVVSLLAMISVDFLCATALRAQTDQFVVSNDEAAWFQRAGNLSKLLASDSIEKKREALFEIRSLRTARASELAIPSLGDGIEIVRATAAGSVIFLEQPNAARVLIPLLNDKSPFVRRETAFALGRVGSTQATAPLIKLLQKDGDGGVRAAVAVALGDIGDPRAISALTAVLKKHRSANEFIVSASAHAVGQIAQKLRFGTTNSLTPSSFLPEKYLPFTIETAAESPMLAFQMPVQLLITLLSDVRQSQDVRREAAFALGSIGAPEAIPILQANLSSKDIYLARICRESLLKINKKE